jgi:hypothetical protein
MAAQTYSSLQGQFRLYEEQVESWKREHEEAMCCRDLEDAIAFLVMCVERLDRRSEEWAREIEAGTVEFSWDHSEETAGWYRRWLDVAAAFLKAIGVYETQSYEVVGAAGLRKKYQEVFLMCLDPGKAREAIESLERGHGIPADRAMNELRDRLRSERA